MPTGYTWKLYEEDQVFSEFALTCARAFFYDLDSFPDSFKPSDFYAKAAEKAREELNKVISWTSAEAEIEVERQYQQELAEYVKTLDSLNQRKLRYEAMMSQVINWQPPTPEHEALKKLMIEQLESGLKHDCDMAIPKPKRISSADFQQQRRAYLENNIVYYTNEYQKEIEETNRLNSWLQALRNSLPETV